MCPMCLATAAWIALGATSMGGISALAVSSLRARSPEPTTSDKNQEQGERYGQQP